MFPELAFKIRTANLFLLVLFFPCFVFASEFRILSVNEPPANYINRAGVPDGYVVDIIKAVQKEVGDNTEIEFIPEARALNIMQSTANTLLFSLSKTKYRENIYLWLGQVMSKKWDAYSLKTSNLKIENIKQLKNLPMIGVVRGDVREECLLNNDFTNLYSVTTHRQNVQRLLMGRVSTIIYEKQGLKYICQELGIDSTLFQSIYTINFSPVFIAVSKGTHSTTFDAWQKAFNKLMSNGEIEKISLNWQHKLWNDFLIESELVEGILHF